MKDLEFFDLLPKDFICVFDIRLTIALVSFRSGY